MPARFLLIDGYNLLHAAGMARVTYGPGDLQRCRERLLRYLAGALTPAEIARTTVIFDARDPPPDRPASQRFQGLTVQFANPGGDADVAIQEWLDSHSAPKRVTLVSSDHVLQRAARRRRAQCRDSEDFFEHLERRRTRGRLQQRHETEAKPGGALSDADTSQWLQFFGDLSVLDVREESVTRPIAGTSPETPAPDEVGESGSKGRAECREGKSSDPRKTGRIPPDDLDYWTGVFGTLPEAEELKTGQGLSQSDLERWLAEFDESQD